MSVLLSVVVRAADCLVTLQEDERGTITVTYDDADGKFVSTSESFTVPEGTVISVTAKTLDRAYAIEGIYVDDEKLGVISSYTVMHDVTVSVKYMERTMCNVTVLPYSNGTVNVSYIDPFDMATHQIEDPLPIYTQSILFIETVPDEGYRLGSILINDEKFTGSSYTLTGDVVIKVTFELEKPLYDYSVWTEYDAELGDVIITDREGNSYADGDKVLENTTVTIKAVPKENCVLESVLINDEDYTDRLLSGGSVAMRITKDLFVEAVFKDKGAINSQEVLSGISFEAGGNVIVFNGGMAEELAVYGMDGKAEAVAYGSDRCDISRLGKGCYVVVVKSQAGTDTFKIYR